MKKYIQPQTTTLPVVASNIVCASVTQVTSSSGPLKGIGESLYGKIKDAL